MKLYNINSKTNAILSDKKGGSIIFEGNEVFEIPDVTPTILIKRYCINNGSTFEGKLKCTEFLTGYKYKAPILLKDGTNLIYFPTNSPRLKDCCWICLTNITNFYKVEEGIRIIFNNNVSLILDMSYFIFNNQFLKATYFDSKLKKNGA